MNHDPSQAIDYFASQALETSDMGKLLKLLEANFGSLFESTSSEGKKTLVQHTVSRQV